MSALHGTDQIPERVIQVEDHDSASRHGSLHGHTKVQNENEGRKAQGLFCRELYVLSTLVLVLLLGVSFYN